MTDSPYYSPGCKYTKLSGELAPKPSPIMRFDGAQRPKERLAAPAAHTAPHTTADPMQVATFNAKLNQCDARQKKRLQQVLSLRIREQQQAPLSAIAEMYPGT